MWSDPERFRGDLDQLRQFIPAWLPPINTGDRVDTWTITAVLAIARRLDEMEACVTGDNDNKGNNT
jgi:hypothetical protein